MGRSPSERGVTGRSYWPRRPSEVVPIAERPEEEDERQRASEAEGPADPSDPSERRDPPTETQVEQELAREILRIHEESYGKGAKNAQTIVAGDWVIVVLDELELLPNEKFLVENGQADSVAQVRTQYQVAIQSSFRAAVERATGRSVIGFTSATAIQDGFVAEIFKLQ
jgi:uncharacterized protein YbcI